MKRRERKDKTPTLLKIVRWVFPRLEVVAPFLARKYFIKIFFTPLKYRVPAREEEFASRADMFSVQVDGKRIQCYSWGKGPMILVIHGWAGRATQFRKIAQQFVDEGYRVVGFDGPGHGRSGGKATNIVEFERTLRVLFDEVGVPEGIVAHSFGGGAALYAAMNGLPIKKLINIASPTIGDEIIATYLRAVNGSPSTGEFFKGWIKQKYGKTFDEFTSLWFVTRLPHKLDLLLIHDENDPEVILRHATELKKVYPGARLLVTRGLGHTRILKDDDVARNCVTFVQNGRLTPGTAMVYED